MALEQKLENIPGNLKDAYKQAVPGAVLCVDQLMKERITNHELRDLWFYTADGEVYSVDNGVPTLRITREAVNPVLKNIDAAFEQLVHQGNYLVPSAEFAAVKSAADTVVIDLSQLTLRGEEKEWRYLAVDTSKELSQYNAEEQKLLGRVFGAGSDYAAVMEMLRQSPPRITETKVFVLAPDYVKANASVDPVGRASLLDNFGSYSDFFAFDRGIYNNGLLRGVRLVASVSEPVNVRPQGDAAKNVELRGLEDVLACLGDDVSPSVRPAVEGRLRKLYEVQ